MSTADEQPGSDFEPSIVDLVRSLLNDTRELIRDELTLARVELEDKLRFVGRTSMRIALGAVLALIGCIALSAALVLGLAHALTPLMGRPAALWVSPLVIGVVLLIVGAPLAIHGLTRLRREPLTLERTARSLKNAGAVVTDRFTAS